MVLVIANHSVYTFTVNDSNYCSWINLICFGAKLEFFNMTLLSLGYRQWENPGSLCSTTGQKRSRKYSHKAAEEWTRSRFERLRTKVCFPFTNVLNTSFVIVPVFIICVELQEASKAWISWKGFVQAKKKILSTKTQCDDGQSRQKCVYRLVFKKSCWLTGSYQGLCNSGGDQYYLDDSMETRF